MKSTKNEERLLFKDFINKNNNLLEILSERDKKIIILIYGLFGEQEHTQSSVASIFGISACRIGQLEARSRYRTQASYEIQKVSYNLCPN